MMTANSERPNHTQPEQFALTLEAARNGNREALGKLLQWYASYLHVLANTQLDRRLRRRLNPSDIVQETMLAAHCDFAAFRGVTHAELLCWLRTILIHVLHRSFDRNVKVEKRDIRREIPIDSPGTNMDRTEHPVVSLLISPIDSPSTSLREKENELEIADLLQRLSPDHRQVIELRIVGGLPFDEVAKLMGRSPGAVRMLWLRALDAVKSRWEIAHGSD